MIVAASRGALRCVQILLAYGADSCATEFLPSAVHPGQMHSPVKRKTAIEVTSPFPEVVEALQTAIYAAEATEKNPAEPSHGTTHRLQNCTL